jgi:hypothetical protein
VFHFCCLAIVLLDNAPPVITVSLLAAANKSTVFEAIIQNDLGRIGNVVESVKGLVAAVVIAPPDGAVVRTADTAAGVRTRALDRTSTDGPQVPDTVLNGPLLSVSESSADGVSLVERGQTLVVVLWPDDTPLGVFEGDTIVGVELLELGNNLLDCAGQVILWTTRCRLNLPGDRHDTISGDGRAESSDLGGRIS